MLRDSNGRFKGAGIVRKGLKYGVICLVVYLATMYAITLTTGFFYNYFYGSLFLK